MSTCVFPDECKEYHVERDIPVQPDTKFGVGKEILKERPLEEVAARLAQQDQEEQDVITCRLVVTTHAHQTFTYLC